MAAMTFAGAHDLYFNAMAREIAPARLTGKFGSEVLRGIRMLDAHPPAPEIFEPSSGLMWITRQPRSGRSTPWTKSHLPLLPTSPGMNTAALPLNSPNSPSSPRIRTMNWLTCYRGFHAVGKRDDIPYKASKGAAPDCSLYRPTGASGERPGLFDQQAVLRDVALEGDSFFHYMPHKYAKIGAFLERFRVQRLFYGRHYMLDYRSWLRHDYKDYVGDMLLDPGAGPGGIWMSPILQKMVRSHLSGKAVTWRKSVRPSPSNSSTGN